MHPHALLEHTAQLITKAFEFTQPTEAVLGQYFQEHRGMGSRERAAVTAAVYRAVRYKNLYDAQIKNAPEELGGVAQKMAALALKDKPELLSLSASALHWLNTAHDAPGEQQTPAPAHRHNMPDWLATKLEAELGESFWPFVDGMHQPGTIDLRVNTMKIKPEQLFAELKELGLDVRGCPYAPDGLRVMGKAALRQLPQYQAGFFEIQDEGSQLIAHLTQARRGEMVVDFCAGAGGKTLALGTMMRNTGRLYAFDVTAARIADLKPRAMRSGLANIYPIVIQPGQDERILRLHGKMDAVLIDAPCSGLGTLRRHPDLKWRRKPADLRGFQVRQLAILGAAMKLLKPGGRLVYASCSILQEENEAVAEIFSTANPQLRPMDAGAIFNAQGMKHHEVLCSGGESGTQYLRTWPHRHNMDGFFAAVWKNSK